MTETLAHGYSSESTQGELSNEYQYDKAMSEPGFRNLVAKIGICGIFRCPIFQGRPQYIQITTINMYLLREISI